MRTTVNLAPGVHRRVRELATAQHASMSSVLSDLVVRGLSQLDAPPTLTMSPRTGFPTLDIGRRVTAQEVADLIDEDD